MIENATSEFNQERIRRIISPITRLLDAPEDLSEFFPVIEQFQNVLRLYSPLSNDSETRGIRRIEELIGRILTGDIDVLKYIPSAATRTKRLTLKPHYEENAHYCTYWHRSNFNFEQQYIALLASLLPVQARLQLAKRGSKSFVEKAYHLGLSIRQLTEPNDYEARILQQLPTEALPPTQLRIFLERIFARYGYSLKTSGTVRSFGYIYRALVWYVTGEWEQGKGRLRKVNSKRESPRHGAVKHAVEKGIQEVSSHQLEQGDSLNTRSFFVDTGGLLGIEKQDIDADPVQDSGKLGETIEISTQTSTSFNMLDRVAITRRKARYVAQAIEMGNQKLPVTHATMSGFELKVLLDTLSNVESEIWNSVPQDERRKIAAWGACRFFLGRDPDDLMNIQVLSMSKAGADILKAKWYPDEKIMWLPCQLPLHKAPEDPWRVLQPQACFTLDLTNTLAPYLRKVARKNHKLFQKNHEHEFSQLVNRLNQIHGTALTMNRLGNLIPGLVAQLAPNDEVMSIYFTGRKPNQHNPSVYSAVPARRLTSLFSQACERVYELAQVSRNGIEMPAFPA